MTTKFKSFEYRLYPTADQIKTLVGWQDSLRFLWNIANEQYFLNRNRIKENRVKVNFYTQDKELTQLRKELPWLNEVPRHLCTSILLNLSDAWNRYFSLVSGKPKFKRKSQCMSLKEFDWDPYCRGRQEVIFPKLGKISAIIHRPFYGIPKSCTIKNDGDQWFAYITCKIEDEPKLNRKTTSSVGLDRGIRNILADSNSRVVVNPRFLKAKQKKITRLQRKLARKTKHSSNWNKAKNQLARTYRKTRRQRKHFLHVESNNYAKNHSVVVIENLPVQSMCNGNWAKGIMDSGWGIFARMLKYKLEDSGGTLLKVAAQNSSQTCSCCSHVDKNSRCGEQFSCTKCGHQDHADVNAAKIILSRMNHSVQPVDGDLKRQTGRSRKLKNTKPCV